MVVPTMAGRSNSQSKIFPKTCSRRCIAQVRPAAGELGKPHVEPSGVKTTREWSPAERFVSGPAPKTSATRPPVDVQSVLCGVAFHWTHGNLERPEKRKPTKPVDSRGSPCRRVRPHSCRQAYYSLLTSLCSVESAILEAATACDTAIASKIISIRMSSDDY